MSETKAIAIVGMGAILPDAFDVPTFWNNIRNRHYSITEVSAERWNPELYFDPDPKAPDKTYTKLGGWVRGFQFEPLKAGIAIPPNVLAVMDPAQQWGIAAARQALLDYGYPQRNLPVERVAVILGNALAGENHYRTSLRIFLPEYLDILQSVPDFQSLPPQVRASLLDGMRTGMQQRVPAITEDTMPGELANIIAGRIANVFNFSGPNFVTDAACASSLAALQAAFNGLTAHQFDAVLTGGVDRSMGPEGFVKFCKIGALSPDGSRPYADGANGFVQGEGAVIFLMKRLEDAEQDGDKIYAVVRGIGGSSDGKGKGITAPNPIGQQRALERAWLDAGVQPTTVGLIEGHGTSTRVGDVAEVNSLHAIFGNLGLRNGSVALGSVKSNIGHLKSAAGAAGLLKAILALKEQILPPSANFERPNPNIPFAEMPFYVNSEARPWEVSNGDVRRAGVSSFGFGGTNFHIVLEEYIPGLLTAQHTSFPAVQTTPAAASLPVPAAETSAATPASQPQVEAVVNSEEIKQFVLSVVSEKTGYPVEMLDLDLDLEADLGVDTVKQAELFATIRSHYNIPRREDLRLSDYNTLAKVVTFMSEALQSAEAVLQPSAPQSLPLIQTPTETTSVAAPVDGSPRPYQGLLFLSADTATGLKTALLEVLEQVRQGQLPEKTFPTADQLAGAERLAIDYADAEELTKRVEKTLKALESENPGAWQALTAQGIFRGSGQPGKVVFMFPGQGSQYVNMLRDLCEIEPVVAETFREADRIMTPILGKSLTSYIFMEGDEAALAQGEKNLKDTTITQPAMLTANVAMLRLMKKFGFRPDYVIGHSLGEYAALVAAEVLTFAEALEVVSARGREMVKVSMEDNGCMAAISAPLTEVEKVLQSLDGYVVLANINSPFQSVIGGATAAVEAAIVAFSTAGHQAQKIPVSHAFHTRIVAPASEPLRKVIERMNVQSPCLPVVANVTGKLYPPNRPEIIDLLAAQVASPVQMVESMKTLYAEGVRVYVEIGPKRVLNALASDNLKEKNDVVILATNHPRKGALASFNEALAGLFAAGVMPARDQASSLQQPQSSPLPRLEQPPTIQAAGDGFRPMTGSIVISGAGLGLPGREQHVFADNNIQSILAGELRIDPLPAESRQAMLDRNITRLVKSEAGAVMEPIQNLEQTLKLAGQRGAFDLEQEFGVPAERVAAYDITTMLAVGAGIEALRDAGIPLVMRYKRTSRDTLLPDRWMLPEALADETGVIFASAFPGMNRLAEETERYTLACALNQQLSELRQLQSLLPDSQVDLQAEFSRRIADLEQKIVHINYQFDRHFIFGILSMGHSQFAEYIGARGPNTQINAACASTTQALGLAEDWINNGRCRRVVIIAGDDITNPVMGPWIGSSFLASGAATTEGDVRQAVLPFDRRRNGMVMGMGAVGLVVESEDAVRERGMRGICEVLATQFANSAFHGTRLDVNHVSDVMERLLAQAERHFGIARDEIAPRLVFVSHETYTPARGGSASAEIHALRRTFGEKANQVVIANTKGFTGHSMAVGIEDVVAVKALEYQAVPPIANIGEGFEPDPELGNLNLSQGGEYPVEFALRLGAGFGSQISMSLLRRISGVGERVNQPRYNQWLSAVCGYDHPELELVQRTLRVRHAGVPQHTPARSGWQFGRGPVAWVGDQVPSNLAPADRSMPLGVDPISEVPAAAALPAEAPAAESADTGEIKAFVLSVVSEKTGYPVEMLDLELDLEADLGVDTVKQAELFATIRAHYNIPRREDLRLSDYNTLQKVIGFMSEAMPGASSPQDVEPRNSLEEPAQQPVPSAGAVQEEVKAFVLGVVSEKTGYPVEMLDLELDLEADLGIDTVKQAELFATIRAHYNIPRREDLRLSEYNTLAKVIDFMLDASQSEIPLAIVETPAPPQPAADRTEQRFVPLSLHYKAPNLEESVCEQFDTISFMKEMLPYQVPDRTAPRSAAGKTIQRRIPAPVLRPRLDLCQSTCIGLEAGSRILVIGGPAKVNEALVKKLKNRKLDVLSLDVSDSETLGKITTWAAEGTVEGVYFLAALEVEPSLNEITLDEWNEALEKRIFALAEIQRIMPASAFLVCATRLGGLHGYGPQGASAPMGGAVSGFTKALGWERPEGFVKIVDFSLDSTPATIATRLIEETLNDPGVVEVGWEGDLRFGIALVPKPLAEPVGVEFPEGSVYLVSGGTGGIIAPILLDLAQVSHGTFYLLGRTQLPERNHPDLQKLKTDRNGLRLELMQRLSQGGQKVTPARVEQVITSMERGAATLDAMAAVEQSGGKAHYIVCDITDPQAADLAVQTVVQEAGRVDVFLHAAGVERSRRLESKPMDEIRQTVAVKANGFFHLFKAMETRHSLPKSIVFFSSVAGRFGNAGQTDYSAANDLLCKMASALRVSYPGIQAVALDWGAWAEVGMASRGHIPALMERAGIEMMRPAEAAGLVWDELVMGHDCEVVLAGSLGALLTARQTDCGLDVARSDAALRAGNPIHTMFSHLTGMDLHQGITLEATLDPKTQPFLKDHSLNGTPVLPGVMGIEGFSVAARHIASVLASGKAGFDVTHLEDIQFLTPFKFYRNEPRSITWRAQAVREERGLVVYVSLESDLTLVSKKVEHMLHFTGRVYLQPSTEHPKMVILQAPHWNGAQTVHADDIYRLYFHGPAFQVLAGVQRSGKVLLGKLNSKRPTLIAGGKQDPSVPVLVELCFQTAGLWEAGKTGVMALPRSIESLTIYPHQVNGVPIYAEVSPSLEKGSLTFNARVLDAKGHLYLEMKNYRTIRLPYTADQDLITPLQVLMDNQE